MILRYLVLFGGIVLLITGCNGLVSQHFGTHRLRTLDLETAATGIGDADYLELTAAIIGAPALTEDKPADEALYYELRPVLTPDQQRRWAAGETVAAGFVAWRNGELPFTNDVPACPPPAYCTLRSLVGEPPAAKKSPELWADHRISLAPDVIYLHRDEAPLPWYWNLAMFVGGGLLALVPEARRFARGRAAAELPDRP